MARISLTVFCFDNNNFNSVQIQNITLRFQQYKKTGQKVWLQLASQKQMRPILIGITLAPALIGLATGIGIGSLSKQLGFNSWWWDEAKMVITKPFAHEYSIVYKYDGGHVYNVGVGFVNYLLALGYVPLFALVILWFPSLAIVFIGTKA